MWVDMLPQSTWGRHSHPPVSAKHNTIYTSIATSGYIVGCKACSAEFALWFWRAVA